MNAITRPVRYLWLAIEQIDLPDNGRPTNATDVVALARSIEALGLQVPLTCIERDGRFMLVAGRHRLEALRVLGHQKAPVRVVDFDDLEARLWTISENLHRSELTVAQRAEQVAEYAELAKQKREAEKPAQVAHVSGGRGNQGGDSLAARDLGISRDEVRRAQTIAALPEATKEAARSLGYDDNQSALLKAARETTPEAQIAALKGVAERGRVITAESARPLRDLTNISGGELARWIKLTTPNDRLHVIRVLEMAAAILRDELSGRVA
jgi:ParB-like chromosome segregation protein Spo0J